VFFLWNVVKFKSKDFWPTIKPFLSNNNQSTVLVEDDAVVLDQTAVTEVFNNYFVNVASDIGSELGKQTDLASHSSIQAIMSNSSVAKTFHFDPVLPSTVSKVMAKINCKKSVGVDGISAKILKPCTPVLLCRPFLTTVTVVMMGNFQYAHR